MEDTTKTRRKKWIKALRERRYGDQPMEQGFSELRPYSDRFCCLGVACEVFRQETGRGKWHDGYFRIGGYGNNATMPRLVAKWYGLDSDPEVSSHDDHQTLSEINDAAHTFDKIADLIEGQLL